ncbi:MAG: photosystem II stability/assembly factor-like uncharacterized protein [Oleiphilaceae bacterium]|jgi:photosystem II stability/assembly factor-like uncharacterized protein
MNTIFTKFRVSLLAGAVTLGSISAPLLAVEDVLVTPSIIAVKAKQNLLLDIAKAGERLVTVGARGHVLYSDDNGGKWYQSKVPVSVLLTSVVFPSVRKGWAVGHSGVILHSSDSGETWEKQFDGNAANQMIITQYKNQINTLKASLELASEEDLEDLEVELEDAEYGLEDSIADAGIGASKPLLDVFFINDKEGFVIGAYGFIFKTFDGGTTWMNYGSRMDNADRFHLNTITQIDESVLIVAGEAGVIFRSEDDGETWETVDSPYEGSFFGLSETGEAQGALAFGLRGNLFRSVDAGVTWEALDSPTESTLISAVHNGEGDISIVGNSGSVLFSDDAGRTFSETIRGDRLGVSSAVFVTQNELIVVGEKGLARTNSAGTNLN